MAIPDYQSLMLPVLQTSANGEIRIGEVVENLASRLNLSADEKSQLLPSGGQTLFSNRVHWAKTYLAKAGLIEATRRGHFKITERGQELLAEKPDRIDNSVLSKYEEFERFRRSEKIRDDANETDKSDDMQATPDELMRIAHKQIETALVRELLERIRAAPPDFFERLIVKLLLSMGFGGSAAEAGRALGRSGDGGIDGVIDQDALGLDRVYIQAKRYAENNSIGSGAIRDFFGSLDRHKAAKGIFVTTSSFSNSATETARYLSKRIVLIDGDHLAKLMIRFNVGCRVDDTLHIKKIDEDFFE